MRVGVGWGRFPMAVTGVCSGYEGDCEEAGGEQQSDESREVGSGPPGPQGREGAASCYLWTLSGRISLTLLPSLSTTSAVRNQSPAMVNSKVSARYNPGSTSTASRITGIMPA